MSRTRYVVRLPHTVVIDTSGREENFNLSLSDWVKRVRRGDGSVPRTYKFNWHHGDNINVDRCELYGRFARDDRGCMSVNLCISCYPVFHCTMEEFMKLFRIGKVGVLVALSMCHEKKKHNQTYKYCWRFPDECGTHVRQAWTIHTINT